VAVWRHPRGLSAARVDEADLARLVDQHGAVLLAYAAHLTGDRSRAEDVTQETLLRAWTHPEALDPERFRDLSGGPADRTGREQVQ